eukprot:scaffold3830_cov85-Cylindrotheca_fusiformis.AAC.5
MEIATRNTSYSASIKPFERNKGGRGAYLALISQHAGRDKWLTEISKNDRLLHDLKWKGNGSYVLERHCAKHRDAYVQMQAASEHVTFQLPDEHTRVTYLLDSIETNDASLQAAIASVKQDEQPGGLRNKASSIAAVEQQLAKRMKAIQQEQQDESQAEAYVMSVLKKLAGVGGDNVTFKPSDATTASNSATTASATSTKNTSLLRSILKSAKNASA